MEKDQLSLNMQGSRRAFMRGAASALAMLALEPVFAKGHSPKPARQYTVQEVIDIILKAGGLSVQPGTVDTTQVGQGYTNGYRYCYYYVYHGGCYRGSREA